VASQKSKQILIRDKRQKYYKFILNSFLLREKDSQSNVLMRTNFFLFFFFNFNKYQGHSNSSRPDNETQHFHFLYVLLM
jgi:hypothetical protein